MRTTLDIDAPVLDELKSLRRREGKSVGRLVSELPATALAARRAGPSLRNQCLQWTSRRMGARVDLADRDALYEPWMAVTHKFLP